MMPKTRRRLEAIERSLDWRSEGQSRLQAQIWEIRHELDLLVAALGMTRVVTNKVEYLKKGGPEKP